MGVNSLSTLMDSHNLSFFVHKSTCLHVITPELEPSGVRASHVKIWRPAIAFNVDRSAFPII